MPDPDDSLRAACFAELHRLSSMHPQDIPSLATADASSLPAVHVSAGVATAPAPENVETLLLRADSALYAAKRAGRDQTVISESEEAPLVGLTASS